MEYVAYSLLTMCDLSMVDIAYSLLTIRNFGVGDVAPICLPCGLW